MLKSILKTIVPKSIINKTKKVKATIKVVECWFYDFSRFLKYSASIKGDFYDQNTMISAITMDYHRIEKGLSTKEPRFKFGLWFIPQLIKNIIFYKKKYGDHEMLNAAFSSIKNYEDFHKNKGVDLQELNSLIKELNYVFSFSTKSASSIVKLNWSNIKEITKQIDFKSFSETRFSIRSFTPKILSEKEIEDAVQIAIKTPSVCNRQPWGVYFITGEKLDSILSLQNGNFGFRKEIKNLIIVVGKISYMRLPIERHQIYIDGGLFSMSLMYAFHSKQIGCCPLNWCVEPTTDELLRKKIGVRNDEEIIMYMAIGEVDDEIIVTASPRVSARSILKVLK